MKKEHLLTWFDEIEAAKPDRPLVEGYILSQDGVAWITDVCSAIVAAFPPGHAVRIELQRACDPPDLGKDRTMSALIKWESVSGVFESAQKQLKGGRIETFVDLVRADTINDVLDQAKSLCDGGHLAAAAVLAGGGLETHLQRFCLKNGLAISGHGSIEKYNTAIGQARKSGTVVYEKADGSQLTGWGQKRNKAAHSPTDFKDSAEQVEHMISGIRDFVRRVR